MRVCAFFYNARFLMNILNKCKKFLSVVVIFSLLVVSSKTKTYPHIPLRGLFTVLKVDDIGFAHALLHIKWIENMYQYGPGKPPSEKTKWEPVFQCDPVVNLVRTLWFRPSEDDQFLPTKRGVLSIVKPTVFGELINAIYRKSGDYERIIELWSQEYTEHIKKLQKALQKLKAKQKEKTIIYKKMDKAIGKVKTATKKYNKALRSYRRQLEKFKGPQEIPSQGVSMAYNEKTKIGDELDRAAQMLEKIKGQKELKESELVNLKKEYKSKIDYRSEIKNIESKLRAIGKCLGVKKGAIESQEAHKVLVDRIKKVIGLIQNAADFSDAGNVYVPRTAQAILWAFFFHKIDELNSKEEKINAINVCLNIVDKVFMSKCFIDKGGSAQLYSEKDFQDFEKKTIGLTATAQIQELFKDYDLALHFLISKLAGNFPPVVFQGSYGYEYELGKKISDKKPNCYEAAMHDLFSILWYNPKTKRYDSTLFSENVIKNGQGFARFRKGLKYFYLADIKGINPKEYTLEDNGKKSLSFTKLQCIGKILSQGVRSLSLADIPVYYGTSSAMKQEFMNIVSGMPDKISYDSKVREEKIYELTPSVENFINLMNYFYGTGAKKVYDLGQEDIGISTKERTVSFERKKNTIEIGVDDKNNKVAFSLTMRISPGVHASLIVPERELSASQILNENIARVVFDRMLQNKQKKDVRQFAFLSLFSSAQLIKDKENDLVNWPLSILNLLFYSFILKDRRVAASVLDLFFYNSMEDVAIFSGYYDKCKGMIHNLLEAHPDDDQVYILNLSARIVFYKGYEQNQDLQNFVKSRFLHSPTLHIFSPYAIEDFIFCANASPNIILQFLDNPVFSFWGTVLKYALAYNYELALQIINHPRFNLSGDDMGPIDENLLIANSVFELALQKGYSDIALHIINHNTFDASKLWVQKFTKKLEQELQKKLKNKEKWKKVLAAIRERQRKQK